MTDIAELFARDPLKLTVEDGDLEKIIEALRKARVQWNLGDKTAGAAKKIKEKLPDIDLGSLGL